MPVAAVALALAAAAVIALVAGTVGFAGVPAALALLIAAIGGGAGLWKWWPQVALVVLGGAVVVAVSLARGVAAREGYRALLATVPFDTPSRLEGKVATLPAFVGGRERVVLREVVVEGRALPARARVLVELPAAYAVAPGDVLSVRGTLQRLAPFVSSTTGQVVDLRGRYAAQSIVGVVRWGEVVAHAPNASWSLLRWNAALRERMGSFLPEPLSALAAGMVFGGRDALGRELEEAFVRSGLIHLVVLSGFNIAVVAGAVLLMARRLPRPVAALVVLSSIAAVVAFAGAEAPAVRAGIMGSVAALGLVVGRRSHAIAALVVATLLIGFFNPFALAYDASLHLSVAATAGVVVWGSTLAQWVARRLPFSLLAESVGATLGAQLAVAPLLWHIAGTLSLVAVPANLLVAPVVPLVMALAAVVVLASFVAPIAALALAQPLKALLLWIVGVAQALAAVPASTITLPPLSLAGAGALYAFLALVVLAARYAARHPSALRAIVSQLRAFQYASK